MKLIFIYGLPATGKLTVARELATVTGYKLFHNHLTVDLLLPVFDFGTRPFVALREEIWLSVFAEACRIRLPGLIFTFAPEATVGRGFITAVGDVLAREGGEVHFVELVCPLPELKRRMDDPTRRAYEKLTSVALFEELLANGSLDASHMPRPALSLDTGLHTPVQAAAAIAQMLKLDAAG